MKLISSGEIVLIGPGSEWFWTALQFVVVVVTLLAIYRQLRAQGAANAVQRMESLQGEWNSERMIHSRLVVAIWRKHAASSPPFEVQVAGNWLCGFFENLSDLEEDGYLTWKEVQNTWGESLITYWALLAPAVTEVRGGPTSNVFRGFERLARRAEAEARSRGEDWLMSESQIPEMLEAQIGRNTARLRMLRDISAGVIPAEPAPVTATLEVAQA